MKVNDILKSNVIDFQRYKKQKNPDTTINVDFDLDKLGYREQSDKDNMELFLNWVKEDKSSFRVPGIQGLDNIIQHMAMDSEHNNSMGFVIAQNKPRIYNALQTIKTKIDEFKTKSPQNNKFMNYINNLEEEISLYFDVVKSFPINVR